MRLAGIGVGDLPTLPLVPLFETVEDLDRAKTTMATLYEQPMYAAQLAAVLAPPGDHARLLGLREGWWFSGEPVGAVLGAGAPAG